MEKLVVLHGLHQYLHLYLNGMPTSQKIVLHCCWGLIYILLTHGKFKQWDLTKNCFKWAIISEEQHSPCHCGYGIPLTLENENHAPLTFSWPAPHPAINRHQKNPVIFLKNPVFSEKTPKPQTLSKNPKSREKTQQWEHWSHGRLLSVVRFPLFAHRVRVVPRCTTQNSSSMMNEENY